MKPVGERRRREPDITTAPLDLEGAFTPAVAERSGEEEVVGMAAGPSFTPGPALSVCATCPAGRRVAGRGAGAGAGGATAGSDTAAGGGVTSGGGVATCPVAADTTSIAVAADTASVGETA